MQYPDSGPVNIALTTQLLLGMRLINYFFTLLMILGGFGCQAQKERQMQEKNNPLLCDPEKGICEIPLNRDSGKIEKITGGKAPVSIIYFTDPICSSCWGIEPQLRKMKLEYGDQVAIDYRMGGLLPDWSYNSGGISKPSDVAHHWDEVSLYYKMPIDGDVWLEDPLPSSYPPSIAFKAAQIQDKSKAIKFLRAIREMVFLEKKNITRWTYIADAASQVGLDTAKLKQDYENKAKELFQADLDLARKLGVRGFPTLIIANESGNQEIVYGFKPYSALEAAITKVYPKAQKKNYGKDWKSLFNIYPTLTAKEFAELSDLPMSQSEEALENLTRQSELTKLVTKNGSLWKLKHPGR